MTVRLWISLAFLGLLFYKAPSILLCSSALLLCICIFVTLYKKIALSSKESLTALFLNVFLDVLSLCCTGMRRLNLLSDVEALRLPGYTTLLLKPHPDVSHERVQIKDDTIDIIIYRPKVIRNNGIIVYAHGGGWVMFTARMFHSAVSWISHETQMVVVSVDYRRSPEHPFPRPLLDVYYTVLWAQLNDSKLGIDASKVTLMGDSSGGNLAAAVTTLHRDNLDLGKHALPPVKSQVLIYPVMQAYNYHSPSYLDKDLTNLRKFVSYYVAGDLSLVDKCGEPQLVEGIPAYWSNVVDTTSNGGELKVTRSLLQSAANLSNVYCFPLLESDPRGLPPTYILALSRDAIRDDAGHYAEWLEANGVEVVFVEENQASHGFMFLYGTDACALDHLKKTAQFIWNQIE